MTVSEVREAFFHGDFERVLALCDTVVPQDHATRLELALLRARALIRLDQADRAVEVLHAAGAGVAERDQRVTLKVLLDSAYVWLGQIRRGITLLRATAAASLSCKSGPGPFEPCRTG
jgi:hypothetical protein